MRRIVANPEILGGKPILEGTRLSVEQILGLLAHGMSQNEIVDSYPELSVDDVNIVVQYAFKVAGRVSPSESPVSHSRHRLPCRRDPVNATR